MQQGREVWWPEGRGFRRGAGVAFAVLFALSALDSVREGAWQTALVPLGAVIAGPFMTWDAVRRRVEADDRGLEVVGLFTVTHVPWDDIAEIRGDSGPGSSRLVLVRLTGEVVRLPLNPTTHGALVARWQRMAADPGPNS